MHFIFIQISGLVIKSESGSGRAGTHMCHDLNCGNINRAK